MKTTVDMKGGQAYLGRMTDDISNTIEVLSARVRAKEDETNKLKKLVNELCVEADIEIRYPGIIDGSSALSAIRADEYYGQTLTAAIRNYLERRKGSGLGAATAVDIHKAIKGGGYKFDTTNETNQKVSVGNALRKTSSIFHRLPNGQYGLLTWYPGAKAKPEPEDEPTTKVKAAKSGKKKGATKPATATTPATPKAAERVTNGDIRDVALSLSGDFKVTDIETAVKAKFPTKELPKTKIPNVLFTLKEKGFLKEVSARSGSRPAVYAKS
jgi:hypothetical protein